MRRRIALTAALALVPAGAFASTMPQMDFRNPLTFDQVGWMVVILVVLYFTLSRWGLPQIGNMLALRDATISADLDVARAAKREADDTVAALNRTMKEARRSAQAEILYAVEDAKAKAREQATAQQEVLEAALAKSEAEITAAREAALAAIKPVAADAAAVILARLTGKTPAAATLGPEIDRAYAAEAVA